MVHIDKIKLQWYKDLQSPDTEVCHEATLVKHSVSQKAEDYYTEQHSNENVHI